MQAKHILVPLVAPRSAVCTDGQKKLQLPVYFSRFYVKQNSSFISIGDLEGSRFAYNDDTSLSGFHCVRFFLRSYLQSFAENSPPFFSGSLATGSHRNSIMAVLADQADVVCLDCNVVAALQSTSTGITLLSQLRPIDAPYVSYPTSPISKSSQTMPCGGGSNCDDCDVIGSSLPALPVSTFDGYLGPNPSQPVVASIRLPEAVQKRIQEAFVQISPRALSGLMASEYVVVDTTHYENIDYMIQDCSELNFFGSTLGLSSETDMMCLRRSNSGSLGLGRVQGNDT